MTSTLQRYRHNGSEVLILDGLFEDEFIASLYRTLNNAEYDSLPDNGPYRSWVCPFDVDDFSNHQLYLRSFAALHREHPERQAVCLSAKARVLTFGDFVDVEASEYDDNVQTILYFANAEWQREWAAETLLFSADGSADLAVQPVPGRIVLFQASQPHRLGVPSRLTHLTNVVVQFEVAW